MVAFAPDLVQQRPESQMARNLYDCPEITVGPVRALQHTSGSHRML